MEGNFPVSVQSPVPGSHKDDSAGRKLQPAIESIRRLLERARRLHEQGADENRFRGYVQRWFAWLHGGLRGRVSTKGRFTRIWVIVLKRLHIAGYQILLD